MKARCPECQSGCERCVGGYVEIGVASCYVSKVCNKCHKVVGGRAVGDGYPPLPVRPDPRAICPWCDSHDLRWEPSE